MRTITALFVGLGSIGTRHLKNLTNLCADRGWTLQADALRSDLSRPLRAGVAALLRAQKVGKRASKAGYDFKDIEEAAEKIGEELSELLQAVKEGDAAHISEETGDLLFSAVNVGRLAGADCEESLRESTKKFVARFLKTESLILQDGKEMQNLAPEELWAYYERAKEQIDADPSR